MQPQSMTADDLKLQVNLRQPLMRASTRFMHERIILLVRHTSLVRSGTSAQLMSGTIGFPLYSFPQVFQALQ